MTYVNIVLSDKGWILERLAHEISIRLPYVRYGLAIDPTADIQYYMTYSTWNKRNSKVELGYFAHLEKDERTKEKFFNVVDNVDYCVCHSDLYSEIIRDHGMANVLTISPGVDLEHLQPKVKIGIVGRTYHTGRKGEALVRQVMDIPGIEWHFTGEGWPGPALKIADGKMADFYNNMDYILVPALYEGGPMSVAEALACGRPVIAPPIGWVSAFPHIEYKTGDADDLRRILVDVVAQRNQLRAAVLDRTWDAWAEGHDRLFQMLVRDHDLAPLEATSTTSISVGLVMHGNEGKSLGGPSVRVPRTADHLRRIGFDSQVINFPDPAIKDVDLLHGFNVWSPISARDLTRSAIENDKPFVLSSIFLDLSEREFWHDRLLSIFEHTVDPEAIDDEIARSRAQFLRDRTQGVFSTEGMPGHFQLTREMVRLADHVILLSEKEKRALSDMGAVPRSSTIVHNPVDAERFGNADPSLFANETGLTDYILCVARIEPRKNQLMLLHALRDLDLPIVLFGHIGSRQYEKLIDQYRKDNVHIFGRVSPDDPLLASAIAGARVFTLPSWSEGAPLAALEAAASGATMVLSDRSSEPEYFGDFARYCDPADPQSIKDAILDAYENPLDTEGKTALKQFVAKNFSWEQYARKTGAVYEDTLRERAQRPKPIARLEQIKTAGKRRIILDVTTSCHHKGRWTGISRSEMSLAQALRHNDDIELSFVAWHNGLKRFVDIPSDALHQDYLRTYFEQSIPQNPRPVSILEGDALILSGSAWMQNIVYAEQCVELSNRFKMNLVFIVYDIIPTIFPFWFEEKYSPVFTRNFSTLLKRSNLIFAISQHTKKDIESFSLNNSIEIPKVDVFYIGETIDESQTGAETMPDSAIIERFSGQKFILNVGAIHSRKNHRLLYDVWTMLIEKYGRRCPHLVLVGGVGWNGHDVARAFREDKRMHGLVHILENIDDATLNWLYENCLFTAYPSLYEGWGLPVAESLSRGKICIASSASSVPEIAPALTDLVDPLDTRAWFTCIDMYATSTALRDARELEIRTAYAPRSWETAATRLIADIDTQTGAPFARSSYTVGTPLKLTGPDAALAKSGGWHVSESWGIWSSGHSSKLRLNLSEPAQGKMVLTILARALAQQDEPVQTGVRVNDTDVGAILFYKGAEHSVSFSIPAIAIEGRKVVDIEFVTDNLVRPKALSPESTDNRNLGVGVMEVAIMPLQEFHFADRGQHSSRTAIPPFKVDQPLWLIGHPNANSFFGSAVAVHPAWGVRAKSGPLKLVLNIHEQLEHDLTLSVTYRACATADRRVRVLVTDHFGNIVGKFEAADDGLHTVRLPISAALRRLSTPMKLVFNCSATSTPHALGIGHSGEAFGIGLFELVMETGLKALPDRIQDEDALPLPVGGTIDFERDQDAIRYLDRSFWNPAEYGGVWTRGNRGRLAFVLPRQHQGDFVIELVGVPYQPFEDGLEPACLVNGVEQQSSIVQDYEKTRIFIYVSAKSIKDTWREIPVVRVEFGSNSAIPFMHERVSDDRDIGFFLQYLRVHDENYVTLPVNHQDRLCFGLHNDKGDLDGGQCLRLPSWYDREETGCWSRGRVGRLIMRLAQQPDADFQLEITGFPYIRIDDGNAIAIKLNGITQNFSIIPQGFDDRILVTVSAASLAGTWDEAIQLNIDISVDVIGVPALEEGSYDHRSLGFFIKTLAMMAMTEVHAPAISSTHVRFGTTSLEAPVHQQNCLDPDSWYTQEEDGVWSIGTTGCLTMILPHAAKEDFLLKIIGVPFISYEAGNLVSVTVNGLAFDAEPTSCDPYDSYAIHVPSSVSDQDEGPLELKIEIRTLLSGCPAELGQSPDERNLGFYLKEILVGSIEHPDPSTSVAMDDALDDQDRSDLPDEPVEH
jgi:glycosyltransferase involved in cell wall biosynthesis